MLLTVLKPQADPRLAAMPASPRRGRDMAPCPAARPGAVPPRRGPQGTPADLYDPTKIIPFGSSDAAKSTRGRLRPMAVPSGEAASALDPADRVVGRARPLAPALGRPSSPRPPRAGWPPGRRASPSPPRSWRPAPRGSPALAGKAPTASPRSPAHGRRPRPPGRTRPGAVEALELQVERQHAGIGAHQGGEQHSVNQRDHAPPLPCPGWPRRSEGRRPPATARHGTRTAACRYPRA